MIKAIIKWWHLLQIKDDYGYENVWENVIHKDFFDKNGNWYMSLHNPKGITYRHKIPTKKIIKRLGENYNSSKTE